MAIFIRQGLIKLCGGHSLFNDNLLGRRCKSLFFIIIIVTLGITTLVMTFDSFNASSSASFNILLDGYRKQVSGIFKKAYENSDGSVDVVFNIPLGAEDLVRVNVSNTGIDKEVIEAPSVQENVTQSSTVRIQPMPSRPSKRMLYPLSIESDYIINSHRICRPGETIDYLIIVHSATAYFERRQVMRQTFAAKRLFGKIRQAIVFLLGLTDDPVTSEYIKREAIIYGDIVQGDFYDSYHNLTHKGVMGYRWIIEYCPQAKLILKLDDDVFVNPFKLIDYLIPMFTNKTRQMVCHVRPRHTSPIQRGKGRWQVSPDEFKGLKYFPFPYCNGYFVLMSSEIIRPMYQAVRLNPFFWIDDVYLFGMLPATIGQVKFVSISQNLTLKFEAGRDCYAKYGLNCGIIGVAQWRQGEGSTLWYMVLELLPESVKKAFNLFDKS